MTELRSSAKDQSDYARRIFRLQLQLARFGVPPIPLELDVPRPAEAAPDSSGARRATPGV
jgi:hypothetical protein